MTEIKSKSLQRGPPIGGLLWYLQDYHDNLRYWRLTQG